MKRVIKGAIVFMLLYFVLWETSKRFMLKQ